MQELLDPRLDLLGLVFGPGEAEQPVVALCRASGYADRRGRMPGWESGGSGTIGINRSARAERFAEHQREPELL